MLASINTSHGSSKNVRDNKGIMHFYNNKNNKSVSKDASHTISPNSKELKSSFVNQSLITSEITNLK